jgi:hypothetical protein
VDILDPYGAEKCAKLLQRVRLDFAGEQLLTSLGLSGLGKMVQDSDGIKLSIASEVGRNATVDAHRTSHLEYDADGDFGNSVELWCVRRGSVMNYSTSTVELSDIQGVHVGGSIGVEYCNHSGTAGLGLLLIDQSDPCWGVL